VAILATLAAPSMTQFIRASRLNSAANQFNADLLIARREAIKRNSPVLVCPKTSASATEPTCGTDFTTWATNGWIICYEDTATPNTCVNPALDGDPNPIKTHAALDSTVTLRTVNFNTTADPCSSSSINNLTGPVKFKADGTATANGAATISTPIYFRVTGTWAGARRYCSTVSAPGQVTITKPPA